MVSTKLQGGLGNQMFQIAVAYAYAKRFGLKCGFDFDSCYTPMQGNPSNKYINTLFKNVPRLNNDYSPRYQWHENGFSFNPAPVMPDCVFHGYFQSERYFEDFKEEIKDLFHFPKDSIVRVDEELSKIEDKDITAVHVRRGDYLTNPDFHPVCSKEYYTKAMEEMGDNNFIFVSDDIEWCKENFKGDNIFYSPFKEEIEDLALMSLSDNQIIANSSLSWWGAYLCDWDNNKVIAPKKWFGPRGPQDTQDLIPDSWIKL